MSLGISIKSPSGIVLAAESRITLKADNPLLGHPLFVHFDNATKLFGLGEPHRFVAAVTYGAGAIGLRSAFSYLPELQASLPPQRLSVREYAERIGAFFRERWTEALAQQGGISAYRDAPMTFVIGGFDERAAYGEVYELNLPFSADPIIRNGPNDFGITWGGQREIVDRILQGYDSRLPDVLRAANVAPEAVGAVEQVAEQLQLQVPVPALPLQDCVDLAIFFIRSTIAVQRLTVGLRGCGGPIDVATITRTDGLQFIQQKRIQGEFREDYETIFPS